ncbi:MAG: lauroyl-Kdo(2)-lipid IV(A) myristoyltransferase, partial [Plesiomonas shigelloides]
MTQTRKAEGHIPKFTLAMLHPRYWPVWLGLLLVALVAFLPHRVRDALAAKLGHFAGRKAKRQRRRAEINLDCCFPEMTASEREKLVDKTFATA